MASRVPLRRKSLRLPDYDYATAGAYFGTICLKDTKRGLGEVLNDQVKLTRLGDIANRVWNNLSNHYPKIALDEFIVMPNHVHGIIWLLNEPPNTHSVGEGLRPSPSQVKQTPSLTEVIRAFKSFSAREINRVLGAKGTLWQRGFYEHIIRNDDDLYQHRQYVRNNPLKWALDEYVA